MVAQWIVACAPMIGLLINSIFQVALAHTLHRTAIAILSGLVAGFVASGVFASFGANRLGIGALEGTGAFILAELTYLALSFGYWAFLNMNITSLRIRTIREMLTEPNGISRADLSARYSIREFLGKRLERLANSKQMECTNGRWVLKSRVLLILVRLIDVLRMIVLPKKARPKY